MATFRQGRSCTVLLLLCCAIFASARQLKAEPVKASATATATASASGTNASAVASANATAHAEAGHNAGHDAGKPVTEASKGEPKKTETAAKPKEEPKTVPTNQGSNPPNIGTPGPGAEIAFDKWTTKCTDGRFDGKQVTSKECADLGKDICGRKDVRCSPGVVNFLDDTGAVVATGETKSQQTCFFAGPHKGTCRGPGR